MILKLHIRPYQSEDDYFRIRNFLREVFVLNGRLEHSWHVARLDHWRWHFMRTCQSNGPLEQVTSLWETEDGQLAAVLHPIAHDEARLHVHPKYRSRALEEEMLEIAEEHLSDVTADGRRVLYLPLFEGDDLRRELLVLRGYEQLEGWGHHWRRDLEASIPNIAVPEGYRIRSMGELDEHPKRSWASWRAFHTDEPGENYDGDWSWYQNIQSAPLYRRDLDIVAEAPDGSIASFCTISYDDTTRSAVCVLVGTAAEHWQRGLGKQVVFEGMRRLQKIGCTRVFATAYDPPADALYRSVMQVMQTTQTWRKTIH